MPLRPGGRREKAHYPLRQTQASPPYISIKNTMTIGKDRTHASTECVSEWVQCSLSYPHKLSLVPSTVDLTGFLLSYPSKTIFFQLSCLSCHANAGYMLMYYSLYSLALYTVSPVGSPLPSLQPRERGCTNSRHPGLGASAQPHQAPQGQGQTQQVAYGKRTSRRKGSIRGTQGASRTWNRFLSIVFLKSSMYHCLFNCSTVRGRQLCHKHCTEHHSSCIQSFWSNSSKQKYITSCTECIVLSSTSDFVQTCNVLQLLNIENSCM